MSMIVVVDDERDLDVGWDLWFKTGEDAAWYIEGLYNGVNKAPITLWLDHDLGSESQATGYDVARLIEENEYVRRYDNKPVPFIEKIFVHSMNPVGARRIVDATSKWIPTKLVALSEVGVRNT